MNLMIRSIRSMIRSSTTNYLFIAQIHPVLIIQILMKNYNLITNLKIIRKHL